MIETLVNSFAEQANLFIEFLPQLLTAFLAALVIYLFGKVAARGLIKILNRSSITEAYHPYFKKLTTGAFLFIAFIVFLNMIGYTGLAASLLAGGGLTAVILGFAFKDIGENFLAGFFLAFSRPFNTNDVIETDGITGSVKSIHLRHTHIRRVDGSDVFIPSVQLFTKPLINYTLDGLRRSNFVIGIDFENDSKAATELLLDQIRQIKGVLKSPKPSVSIRGFDPNFVELEIFFWISAKDQEISLQEVRTAAMDACRKALIENGFIVSSNVKTAVELSPVDVELKNRTEKSSV